MLYFFHGADIPKIKDRVRIVTESLLQRKPDASVLTFSTENWSRAKFQESLEGQALFEHNLIVVCDRLFELPETDRKLVLAGLKTAAEASHVFIFIESELKKTEKDKLESLAVKTEEHDLPAEPVSKFDVFALTEALAQRDRQQSWLQLQQALLSGKRPEELYGLVLWQIRAMTLAKHSANAQAAGLKPFVYRKARAGAERFSSSELKELWQKLLSAYHDWDSGRTMEERLEKVLLSL